jgi:hypothetical protein
VIADFFARVAARVWHTLRDGVRLWWLAPLIPLIAVVPEFIQHVAEIRLGMFASKGAFASLAMDPTRWAFGYAKIAGLFLAIFAAARFWAVGSRWWDLRTIAWRPFLIGLALNAVVSGLLLAFAAKLGETAGQVVNAVVSLATLPLLVLMIGGLLGDAEATVPRVYRSGWLQAVLIGVLFFGVMLGLQPLHRLDHTLAMGAQPALVWVLMAWDSVVVGTMAALAGTAFHHGYRSLAMKLAISSEASA